MLLLYCEVVQLSQWVQIMGEEVLSWASFYFVSKQTIIAQFNIFLAEALMIISKFIVITVTFNMEH